MKAAAGVAVIVLAWALAGCATQEAKVSEPAAPIDISAIGGKWEGRSKMWGTKIKLEVFNDENGRAIAKYCWGGWCRTTRATYALRNAKITPTSVEFLVGTTNVRFDLEGAVLKGLIDPRGKQWDHTVELKKV